MLTIAGGIVLAVFILIGIPLVLYLVIYVGSEIAHALTPSGIPPRDEEIEDRIVRLTAGVSANLLYGFGQIILQSHRTPDAPDTSGAPHSPGRGALGGWSGRAPGPS
jgi:hypothetical protein